MEVCTAHFNDGSLYKFNVDTREEVRARAEKETSNKSGGYLLEFRPCRRNGYERRRRDRRI